MIVSRAVLAAAFAFAPAGSWAADYVGSNVCRTCHPDVWSTFFKNPHYKGIASGKELQENTGCESCHGPGKAHVEARGGKATIIAFSQLSPDKILDACLRCHSETLSRANIRRSSHTEADVVCSSCHSIHKSPAPKFLLAKQQQRDLCYGCHSSVRAQFSMPFKHRVNEGTVQCTDCHNPHGAFDPTWKIATRPRMMEQSVNEEACLKCHIDKRGPFVYEHGSVRVEGCETCHSPHGSMNARLLRRPTVFTMCLECHNGQGSFGSFGPKFGSGVQKPPSDHNLANPRYQSCTTCHARIHGSNTSEFFFR